jgi:ABC-2 type transport system ATP-binding protein
MIPYSLEMVWFLSFFPVPMGLEIVYDCCQIFRPMPVLGLVAVRLREARNMDSMVELDHITKHFGAFIAVDGISLNVKRGEVLGFLGPNGAGKSTTMRMVAGFLTPTSGTAKICGHDVALEPVTVKSMLGYMAEGSPSYDDMTVRAFLSFIANVRGLTGAAARSKIDDVISKVSLEPVIDRPIDVLSKGFKRRVGLAQAILHDPPVLILDEPTDGLDPNQKHQVRSLIQDMAAEKAIIVSTHILEEVEAVCTRAVIIGSGKVLADGTSDQLLGMLPEHNAISVVMPSGTAEVATAQLKSLADVADVTQAPRPNGEVELRCLPKNGTEILDGVVGNLRANGIAYSQLYVNRGDLDAVFRTITAGGASHA